MHATVGDKLHIRANHAGAPVRSGRILEIRGANGAPPYVVEFADGRTRLVFPGPDAVVEPARPSNGGDAPSRTRRVRRVHTRVGW
ncbi:MAG: DUF1918 domain-containing protein [Actinocrinis sp.]